MRQYRGNISGSVLLSIALHVAIVGSAVAFAQYGGGTIGRSLPHIEVSLVGPPVKGTGILSHRASQADHRRTRLVQPQTVPSTAAIAALQNVTSDMPYAGDAQEAQSPEIVAADGSAGQEGAAQADPGAGIGKGNDRYSSDQWQVLSMALDRVKSYPRFARERGIEGTVLVRFRARPSGSIEQVDIVKSSGARILDEASVSTVYRAAPVPYVDGWIEVPMVYQIRRAGDK